MAMTATITSGLVAVFPSRDAQSSHRAPSQPRQPLRVSRAPQFAQKFERLIVGVFVKAGRIIFLMAISARAVSVEIPPLPLRVSGRVANFSRRVGYCNA